VILADQASKAWALAVLKDGRKIPIAGSILDLKLVDNPGSAFGFFRSSTFAVFAASLLILSIVAFWGFRNPEAPARLGLVIGGGAGNIVDRLVRPPRGGNGRVIDFIHLSFWPTFNLADSCIVIGVGLLLLGAAQQERSH
jgi:signal peptidase II